MQTNNNATNPLGQKLLESLKKNGPQLQRNNLPSSFIKLKLPNRKPLDLALCWLIKSKLTSS
jgi:hypothetical protein